MSFIDKIIKSMQEKGLSENSIKTYIRNLNMLNDHEPIKNLSFLNNTDKITEFIDKKKINTQKNYYISIVAILKNVEKKNKKTFDYYYNKMMELNKDIKDTLNQNIKSETQKDNWIDFEDLQETFEEMNE